MSSYNRVILLGNLTRDPELKFTAQGTGVCNFSLAVNRQYKGADGEIKKEVSFFNIVVWGKSGENCGKYLKKGSSALVEGRLSTRSYEEKDTGKKRYVTETIGEKVQFLSSPGENRSQTQQQEEAPQSDPGADEVPY